MLRPLRHPAFVLSALLFLLHQVTEKLMGWRIPWADSYLDNLLCFPILLTGLLAERRWWKKDDSYTFSLFEIIIITAVLSWVFEFLFPKWSPGFTTDYWDVVAYFTGAMLFNFFINKK